MGLLPKQQEFIFLTSQAVQLDVAIYQGGYGAGKTYAGSRLGIALCQKYPGILGLVCAKTYPLVKNTTLRMYKELLKKLGFKRNVHYTLKGENQGAVIRFRNGSEILFTHLQDPDKVKSLNLGFVQVEEISQISESDFDMLLSRLRQQGIKTYRLFGHTNPQPTKGWIYKYFVEQNPGSENIHYRRIIAPTSENIHNPPHYVESMKSKFDPEYYRINVLGEDGDYTSGLVSYGFSDLNIIETDFKEDLTVYLTCDFNVDPMMWALAHRFNGEYHFFDEIVIENTNINQCVDEFIRRYPNAKDIIITGDASGNNRDVKTNKPGETSYTIMRNRFSESRYPSKVRVDVREQNPHIVDRVAAWNAMLCNADGVRRIFFHPRCEWSIYNCYNLKYKEGTGIIDEPTQKEMEQNRELKFKKHIFDAESYLVEKYDSIQLKLSDKKPSVFVHNAYKRTFRKA